MKRSKWFFGGENDLMIQGSGMSFMKNGEWMYCSGWGVSWVTDSLNDFSWTCLWHWDGLVALTPKDGWHRRPMVRWPVNGITQPDSIIVMEWTCHVQERIATINFFIFFFFFLQSLLTSTFLFLSSLRRITYACSIIFPSGKPVTMF